MKLGNSTKTLLHLDAGFFTPGLKRNGGVGRGEKSSKKSGKIAREVKRKTCRHLIGRKKCLKRSPLLIP